MESLQSLLSQLHDTWSELYGGPLAFIKIDEDAESEPAEKIRISILHEGQPYAVLTASPPDTQVEAARTLLESWAALLEATITARRLSQGLTDELIVAWNRLNFLHQMTGLMRSTTDPWELSLQSLELAAQTIEVENAFIAQEDRASDTITVRCLTQQFEPGRAQVFVAALDRQSTVLVCNSPAACAEADLVLPGLHSLMGRRLEVTTGPRTYIGLINQVSGSFRAGDIQLFESLVEQITTVIEVEALHRQQLRTQQIERDLELAAEIQASFLPASLPKVPGYELAARLVSASEIGGDFYEVFQRQTGITSVLVCDIAGKGISAALLAADVRATVRAELRNADRPGRALQRVNARLYADMNRIESFATAILLTLPGDGELPTYASAGHTTALWVHAAEQRIEELPSISLPLGVLPDIKDESVAVDLHPDDILLLYSDGLLEVEDEQGQMFGLAGISRVLLATHTAPTAFILESLIAASERHRASSTVRDDLTIIVIRQVTTPTAEPVYQRLLHIAPGQVDLSNIHLALDEVEAVGTAPRATRQWYMELRLAIVEALTNVISHGYEKTVGETTCLLTLYADHILVDIYDQGRAFTPPERQPLVVDTDDPPEGGYGLHIIHEVMDEVHYAHLPGGYNHLRLLRWLPAG